MWLDIICLIVLLFGLWKGWKDGLIVSVFSVLAWLAGIAGGLQLTAAAARLLQTRFNLHNELTPVLAFVLVFVLIGLTVYLLGRLLERFVTWAQLGWLNRILGMALRSLIFLFLLSVIVWLLNQAGLLSPELKVSSQSAAYLLLLADHGLDLLQNLMPPLRHALEELQQFFDSIENKMLPAVA